MEGSDRLLVLAAHTRAVQLWGERAPRKLAYALRPSRQVGVELGARGSGSQQLTAVVADIGDAADRDDLACRCCSASTDAAHKPVALGYLDQQRARRLGHMRIGGMAHDRRQRAVDIKQHGCMIGVGAERLKRLHKQGGRGHDL